MRVNQAITIVAGTPVNVVSGLTTKYTGAPVWARAIFVQMRHGGTGLGIVMDGIVGRVPASTNPTDQTAEVAPATATAPSAPYTYQVAPRELGFDVSEIWIDGSHSGDVVNVSYDQIL